jgi:receptor-interacting serine/threonine-protein kinase 5
LPKHERLVDLHGSVIDHTYGGGSSIAVLRMKAKEHIQSMDKTWQPM